MLFVILAFFAITALLLYLDSRKPGGFPPGPAWLPILGSAHELAQLRRQTGFLYKACGVLAERYGALVGLRVGKDRIVVVSGLEAIREMCAREEFDGRPRGPFYETRTFNLRRGVLLTDSDFWVEQRRFVLRQLREFGFGRRTMAELVRDEAGELARSFADKLRRSPDGVVVSMHDTFSLHTLNTLWTMLAGIRYTAEDKELLRLQSLLNDLFTRVDMAGALFSQFPILQYVAPHLSGYTDFVDIHERLWRFLGDEIDRHKETFDPAAAPRDFMDVYIKMIREAGPGSSFSELQLLAICLDLFMAGSETTSKGLAFCFLYLLRHPEVQRRAQAEIDAVVGRERTPDLSDRPNMPYMDAVALESLRMLMGRTFAIPHRAVRDSQLLGHFIPKETTLIINIPSVVMDKRAWGDPHSFRPERFLRDGKVFIPDAYLTFGCGKHRCPGETLARSNVFLFTAALLQRFDFRVPPGEPLPSTEGVDSVSASTGPYSALVTPRP